MLRPTSTSDKSVQLTTIYERAFAEFRRLPVNILELGVHHGGSLKIWRDYFPRGRVFGVDIQPPKELGDRIVTIQGDQTDPNVYDAIARDYGVAEYDIIIDDASHYGHLTQQSFDILFARHLKSGGIYAIEDWGTGYMPNWPDGLIYSLPTLKENPSQSKHLPSYQSHMSGMVGVIKSLVDCVGYPDIQKANSGVLPPARVASIHVYPTLALLYKP